ncbi:thiamine-phosphate pyrophosphorylase [Gluconacetobacter diazotrophicus PA1 5]|uniref:Thiamine-phosphate synthase n=2 Tax=Gluconacetobacter diazotrophicus TaxID=33996 RepID=A9H6F4_GLUDA|nr:thiamine phosphate synthase [Gluconacetobacter diazotrophicus]ACI51274.1 thiamine-phosphate pyrophosphorylase [Gluconacetobacter diazotrophicus PA1 5]MBB2155022.1 thiamine phosphate synthase [Gluconacetobacter diazotrophicus]TWB09822.1 thiamine-phosphate diphosphorylase [Gluconacetobacter diazotrophicus]CAP54455.1 putative thiamine-phosphate pyrophosphorylase [Gluconacetobacter diazotrophicus PA1 5]
MNDCQLYLVTPPALDPAAFAPDLARALDAGAVAAVQLRLTDATDDAVLRAVDVLRPVAQERDVAFILNGRPDLARRTGCDGVHIDAPDLQDGTELARIRAILGEDLQLGVSCRDSRDLAMRAGEAGADYVSFGAFFPSASVETPVLADPALLAWWTTMMELPVVAIGGITPANCAPLVQAGADFLAVIGAVWSHPDGPAAGVRAMNAAIDAA